LQPDAPGGTARFLRTNWRFLAFGFLVAFWSSPGQTYLISLFGAELRRDFGLGHGAFGGLYALATLASAAILLYAGQLIDRLPLKRFALLVILAMIAATAGFSLVAGPVTLTLGILALRFTGQGLMSHTAVTAMARRFSRERGRAIAVASLGFPVAEGLLPPLIVAALALVDWRWIWPALAAAAALTLLPLLGPLLRAPSTRRAAETDGSVAEEAGLEEAGGGRQWTRRELLRDPRFYLLAPVPIAQSSIITGVMFHQVHLVSLKGWSLETWGAGFLAYAAASIAANLAAGLLIDRIGARRLIALVLLPVALSLLLFASAEAPWSAPLVLGLMGAGAGAHATSSTALWAELYGTRHLGAIRALAAALSVFASALGPVLMGLPLDAGISPGAILLVSAALVAASCGSAALAVAQRA